MARYLYRVEGGDLIPLGDWSGVDDDEPWRGLDLEEGAQAYAAGWLVALLLALSLCGLVLAALSVERGLRRIGGLWGRR